MEVMAARLSGKTQILLGVKFKPPLIFSLCLHQSLTGWIGSIPFRCGAFSGKAWGGANVGLLVNSPTPTKYKELAGESVRVFLPSSFSK